MRLNDNNYQKNFEKECNFKYKYFIKKFKNFLIY